MKKTKIKTSQGFLLAFNEIFLKSKGVQNILKRKLIKSFFYFLKKEKIAFQIHSLHQRIFLETTDFKKALPVLKNLFGLSWFSQAFFLPGADLQTISIFVKENYQDWIPKGQTFALKVNRGGVVPESRTEIIQKTAAFVDRPVNLDHPQKEIFLEACQNGWFIYFKKQKASGGLPLGSQGKILSLISGGIDSPVAAYLVARKGAENIWLHFHSYPLVSPASIQKTKQLAQIFLSYQPRLKIYLVPFAPIQKQIKLSIPPQYRVLLYRRLMFKIAQKIAAQKGCLALVTGESLGQVSSQTLPNLAVTSENIKIPILRPLIEMDKEEIISLAKKINTYEISIQPQEDCCTLFIPKGQTAAAKIAIINQLEKTLPVTKLIAEAIKKAEAVTL